MAPRRPVTRRCTLVRVGARLRVRLLQVLGIYPSTIRRRILRHLYQSQLHRCYLFADCKPKFLDAVLAAARVELFMPQARAHLTR